MAQFKVRIRRSSWLCSRSFRSSSRRVEFERSSAYLNILLSKTRSFHFTGGLGYGNIYGANLRRFRYWRTTKYEGWFLFYDYEDYIKPTLLRFRCKRTRDPNAHLSDDDIDCPEPIKFCNLPVQRPEEYPMEQNCVAPADPLESITFRILNRRTPKFMQSDSGSFHARFYGPGEKPSKISPRFHPREEEDIDTTLPWRVALDDAIQAESAGEASRREYIKQKESDKEELEAMMYWGPKRSWLYEEAAARRAASPPRGRGAEIAPPSHY